MNTALIRQLNISRLFHALRENPDSSQRELAEQTGIDKATVSAVVGQLEQQGLIARSTRRNQGRVGRPEVALRISDKAGLFVGARLEPSTIRVIATSLGGQVLQTAQAEGSKEISVAVKQLSQLVREVVTRCGATMAQVKGIGAGIPALMDLSGNLVFAPNLGWRDVPILSVLQELFPVPVYADNDTKAAALAEKHFGACRDKSDFIFITGHSGVGGGLYLGGSLYRGFGGYAGEVGHMKVVPGGRLCGCGGQGCLEAYLSEASIVKRLAEAGVVLADLWEVAEGAERGDPVVLGVLEKTGEYLGVALANVINLINPQLVVLGGNLAVVAPYTLPATKRLLAKNALEAPGREADMIVSPLGVESVPMGGVALAMEGFLSPPNWLATGQARAS